MVSSEQVDTLFILLESLRLAAPGYSSREHAHTHTPLFQWFAFFFLGPFLPLLWYLHEATGGALSGVHIAHCQKSQKHQEQHGPPPRTAPTHHC